MVRKLLFGLFSTFKWCQSLEPDGASSPTTIVSTRSNFKLMAVVAIAAVALVIGALLVNGFVSSPQSQDGWLFKGAYAAYEGSTSFESGDLGLLSMGINIDFGIRLEIVDFNSTHAFVSTSFRMSSSFGETNMQTVENQNSTWVPLSQMSFIDAFEELDLANSFESTVDIVGFGSRSCTVYEYELSDEGLKMAVYVDKTIKWPLKMTVSMTGEDSINLSMDINLKETNIPALN